MNPSMAIQQTVDTEILKQLANIFQTIPNTKELIEVKESLVFL